jgi:quercetin dioxygenase-like cupin family protein/ketosteroid isomerase-like protein
MRQGASTPEELESLFEDAFVIRDRGALAELFEEGAVLVPDDGEQEARGGDEIALFAAAMWDNDHTYVADPRRVLQARDTALVVAGRSINVMHRGSSGEWRYAISLLTTRHTTNGRSKAAQGKKGATMQETSGVQLAPVAVPAGEGEARWWFGALAVIKATSVDTGGQMTIVEITEAPGAEAPLHVHHHEDEAFWVLEGDVTFEVGETTIEAHAGDYAFGPREIPHRYTVGEAGCRMLLILTPGGFDEMVMEMSEPAGSRTLPPPSEEEPDWERIAAIAKAYGNELLA